jgi:threonine/homoserine/homoserine lactone efflux protein
MFGTQHFLLFLTAGILLNLAPGPDTFYIIGRTLSQGRKAGIYSVLGIATGCVFHTLCAAIGLSALLYASALAFTVLKIAGAAYLVYQGFRMLWSRGVMARAEAGLPSERSSRLFVQGMLTNMLNPKVAIFFLAFLPQFVDTAHAGSFVPFLVLGCTFVTTGTLWCLCLVFLASGLGSLLRRIPAIGVWIDRLAGSLFIYLGLRLAFEKR